MRLTLSFALLAFACTSPNYGASRDTATQLNGDQRYAHASNGDIIDGPSLVNEVVVGQADPGGGVHVVTDRWFIARADQISSAQLAMANLARQHASAPAVTQLADRYATEQERINEQLQTMAGKHFVTLDGRLSLNEQASYLKLSQLSGQAFDHAYVVAAMQLDQEQLSLWNQELHSTNDRQMLRLAWDTLPSMRNTHQMAQATSVHM